MKKVYCLFAFILFVLIQTKAQNQLFQFAGKSKNVANEFLVFYSNNCQFCTDADKNIRADASFLQKLQAQYKVRAFDIGTAEGKQAAVKLEVSSVPAFVLFKAGSSKTVINGFKGTKGLGDILFSENTMPAITQPLAPPPNDDCAGAITLTGLSGTVSGDNTQATNSGMGGPLCQTNWQKDVWYKFTLASTTFVNIYTSGITMTDPILVLYSSPGDCNSSFFQIDCNDDGGTNNNAALAKSLSAGTYYIRLAGFGISSGIGTFNLLYNLNTTCANGVTDNGEQCDDSNLSGNDGCSPTCTFENPGSSHGVGVNEDGTPANPSAILDIKSPNKGLLVPRITTTQRNSIFQPSKGLLIFDVTTNSFWYYTSLWNEIKENKKIAFFAAVTSTIASLTTDTIPIFDTIMYNDGNDFSNNVFTVPEDGIYSFTASVSYRLGLSSRPVSVYIETATDILSAASDYPVGGIFAHSLMTAIQLKLTTGTKIWVRINPFQQSGGIDVFYVKFFGHKIY